MDLETIGKKMLEALAVQGQIASTQTKVTGLQGEVAKATDDIRKSQATKALNLDAREQAGSVLANAVSDVEIAEQQVAQAKAGLKSAKLVVGRAEEEVDKYSDVVLGQLDEVTQQFQEDKRTLEAEVGAVQKELEVLKKDLEARQAELKTSGVELNLGGTAPRPKTTTL